MQPIYDALALRRARGLHAVGIVAELRLVDACGTADGGQGEVGAVDVEQRGSIEEIVLKLIVVVKPPLRSFAVFGISLKVEVQGLLSLALELIKSLGRKDGSTWHVFAEGCAEVLAAPRHINNNLFHDSMILWMTFIFDR